ncbi:hypothetical protein ABZ946_07550 [Streptomyces sp. NPDC046324]|uniref:hypothetical protein n=1 Tax=Streptomyces sp. NPDC046324 TaxID=3154915 RepID=UPI0033DD3F06
MISNINSTTVSFVSTDKMTDRSVVSACSLGLSASAFIGSGLPGTGLSGAGVAGAAASLRPAADLAGLPVMERDERPTKALEAGVAAVKATAYGFAATGAETKQQTTQHHTMWAFRGLEPWSDPA